ncbi:MAG: ATP-binding protein [Mycobacteriales bacterium]
MDPSAFAASLVVELAKKHGITIDPKKPLEMYCPGCGKVPASRPNQPCPACTEKANRARWKELIDRAWATVPKALSWVSFDEPDLGDWVTDDHAIERARASVGAPLVTLVGPAGAGKTTLALCVLHEFVQRGSRKGAKFHDRRMAANMLFTTAIDLVHARAEHPLGEREPPLVTRAERASVLVLDELGAVNDPHQTVFSILHHRHANEAPTIVTTWMSALEVTRAYGGGIARRLWQDGVVIEVRKKESGL